MPALKASLSRLADGSLADHTDGWRGEGRHRRPPFSGKSLTPGGKVYNGCFPLLSSDNGGVKVGTETGLKGIRGVSQGEGRGVPMITIPPKKRFGQGFHKGRF